MVKNIYRNSIPFDMKFDLETNEQQYCSEMVAKCIGSITGNKNWATILEYNHIRFIPVESIYHNKFVREKKRFAY